MAKYDSNYWKHINNDMTRSAYQSYIEQKGYTQSECYKPAVKREFPLTIYGRTFETEEEYQEAIHDMLNGM